MSVLASSVNSGSEVAAWMAALGSGVALSVQAYNVFKKRRKEKEEIDEALDRQPLVKQQLELGNVGEAVKHLNAIISSQAKHMESQDQKLKSQSEEIRHLSLRNAALEAEAEGWERRYHEFQEDMDKKFQRMEEEYKLTVRNMERSYARSLTVLRKQTGEDYE
jgi:chromosome segregation ATPase